MESGTGRVCLDDTAMHAALCFSLVNEAPTATKATAAEPARACEARTPDAWSSSRSALRVDLGDGLQLRASVMALYPPSPPQPPSPPLPPLPPPRPPGPPPRPPPPISTQLSTDTCDRMWADSSSLLLKMWGVQPRRQRKHGMLACWDVARDFWSRPVPSETFFADLEAGTHCGTDWYAESRRNHGDFPSWEAPALLGLDEYINRYCGSRGGSCDKANANILQLRPLSHDAGAHARYDCSCRTDP